VSEACKPFELEPSRGPFDAGVFRQRAAQFGVGDLQEASGVCAAARAQDSNLRKVEAAERA